MIFDGPKFAMYAGAALIVSMLAYKAYDGIGDAREATVRAEYAKSEQKAKDVQAEKDRQRRIEKEESDRAYQQSLADLQAQMDGIARRPTPGGIRLCKQSTAGHSDQARVPNAAGVAHDSTDGRESPLRAGDDIERELVQFAGRCEADRLKVLSLQSFIDAQAQDW